MASYYRDPHEPQSTHDGYFGQELGRMQHQNFGGDLHGMGSNPHALSLAQPHDLLKDVQKEIDKEQIRQEIIMSEILKRRAVEAEVRRELMVEMELASRGGINGVYGSPSLAELDLTARLPLVVAERRFLEKRMAQSLAQMDNLSNRHESKLSESLQFRSVSDNVRLVRTSEVEPGLEGVKEKKKINLQAKVMENTTKAANASKNVTGVKRASSHCSQSGYSNVTEKSKEEWRCDLCRVSSSSERGLNEHMQGKKHKMEEAASIAQNGCKTYSIGLDKQKATKSIISDPNNSEGKFASETLPFIKSGDASSAVDNPPPFPEKSDILKKNGKECTDDLPPQPSQENGDSDSLKNGKGHRFWCEICKIGVFTQKSMDIHKKGRKHRRRVDDGGSVKGTPEQDGIGPDEPDAAANLVSNVSQN